MEVLTRSSSGTNYTYYRYQEGDQPFTRVFAGKAMVLDPDQLILGVNK